MKRKCDNCGKEYEADIRNINRGWGLTCSKSCAASKREKSKPNYNPERVAINNVRREIWNEDLIDKDFGDKCSVNEIGGNGKFRGRTSEGYRIFGTTAYDEWGEPIYAVDENEDGYDHGQWND